MMHARIASATTLLVRALTRAAAEIGVALEVIEAAERPWASVTFTGARHRLVIEAAASDAFDDWLAGIGEAEMALRGYVALEPEMVAVEATAERIRVTLEVLTLVDG